MNRRDLLKLGAVALAMPDGLSLGAPEVPADVMAEFQGVAFAVMGASEPPESIYLVRSPLGRYYARWTHATGVVCSRMIWARGVSA